MGHLHENKASQPFSLATMFGGGSDVPDSAPAGDKADVYIIINATCVELPYVQQYVESRSTGVE